MVLRIDHETALPANTALQNTHERFSQRVAKIFRDERLVVSDTSPSSSSNIDSPRTSICDPHKQDLSQRASDSQTVQFSALVLATPTKNTKSVSRKSRPKEERVSPTKVAKPMRSPSKSRKLVYHNCRSLAKPGKYSAIPEENGSQEEHPRPSEVHKAASKPSPCRAIGSPRKMFKGIHTYEEDCMTQDATKSTEIHPFTIRRSPRRAVRNPIKSYTTQPTSCEESESRTEWRTKMKRNRSRYVSPFGHEAQQACDACQARMGGGSSLFNWSCGVCTIARCAQLFESRHSP